MSEDNTKITMVAFSTTKPGVYIVVAKDGEALCVKGVHPTLMQDTK